MKNILTILILFAGLGILAQAPQKINYQAIARDSMGNALQHQAISARLSIHSGSSAGTVVYQETDTATTNQFGLFSIVIGSGTVTLGSFGAVNWGSLSQYLEVEFDPHGGSSFTSLGTSQLVSVPYAIYAGSTAAGFSLPYNYTGSTADSLFSITNTYAGVDSGNTLQLTSYGEGVISEHSIGNTGNFFKNNVNGVGAGVRGEVNSIFGNGGTAGVYGVASGSGGYAGYFEHTDTSGYGVGIQVVTFGLGIVAQLQNDNAANTSDMIFATNAGTGITGHFLNTNTSSTANVLSVVSVGPGVIADHSQGNAGNFFANNVDGVGAGVRGEVNSIFGNNGTAGVYGVASGSGGYAGYFEHTETTGFGITLQVITNDLGTAMVVDHEGTSGNLAIFETLGSNVARIDRTGKGYFDGGTQNSGADVAEAFDVTGDAGNYEAGDVLAIATSADRTVEKSSEAYSSLVVGVYATKPGVLLTEENIDSDLHGKVPMGVIGVIPTKVCNENGPIKRGDLLVTASMPGYAMKADLNKVKPGQVIGKALENLNGKRTGLIKVLVSIK